MKAFGWFVGGAVVGALVMLQWKSNATTCQKRVAAGVREEVVDAVGPLGGTFFDVLNLGAVANQALDLFGVPYDA